MRAKLPSISVPGGFIHLIVTDFNWQTSAGGTRDPRKTCIGCGKSLPILDFVVRQTYTKIKGVVYGVLSDDAGVCRKCQPTHPDFHYVYHGRKVHMRLALHNSLGRMFNIWDPVDKVWGKIINRGIRKMPGKEELRMQPQRDRQHDKKGRPYAGRKE